MQRAGYVAAFFLAASFCYSGAGTADVAPYAHLKFREVGPALSGGRVPAVAGTDADPFLYLIGGSGGGVFRTDDGGTSWDAVFAHKPVSAIGAIAIAPSKQKIVWVGTGEANPRNDVMYGDGVWKSTDGGKTFKHFGLDGTSQISKILIDPQDPNVVLVGALGDPFKDSADRGVYRSTDGGKTWTKTLYVGPQSGASDLAWNPRKRVVFAGIWQYRRIPWSLTSGGPDDGLYRSTDGGVTWTKLTGNGLPTGLWGRVGVAIAPSNPRRVYAVIQSKQGVLWRSDDGGNSWRLISSDTIVNQRPFYYTHVFVDPTNANHVIAQSVEMAESKDGGRTWKRVRQAVHGDHHDLWWAADGKRIIESSDGGVAISHDGGSSWEWRNNMTLAQIYHLGYDLQNPYTVCVGLQDNQSWCAPSNSLDPMGILGRHWYFVQGGDGMWAWPDPLDPNLVWSDLENGVLGIFDKQTQEVVDISPYPRDTNGIPIADLPYRFNWDAPIAFDPFDGHVAYFGANVVFKTTDRGRHWEVISPDLTLNEKTHQQVSGGPIILDVSGAEFSDTIMDIAPSPIKAGLIWVGVDDGLVQLTTDGGGHWKNVTPSGVEPYGRVETVEPSHYDPATAFAAVDRHRSGDRAPYLFETNDYGATWRSIVANLPKDQYVRSARQDPRNPNILYAGLEQGLWISFDAGKSWQSLQLNLPTSSVRDIRVQPVADDLIVATHGRGLWILDDLTGIQQLVQAKSAGAYFFQPRTAYRWTLQSAEQAAYDNSPTANNFAGDNPDAGAMLTFYQTKPSPARPTIEIVDAAGRVVRHIAGTHDEEGVQKPNVPNYAGINRLAWGLTEDPPVKWNGAPRWNRGPDDGAEVVPGVYSARLHIGSQTLVRTIVVKPDPRAHWTQAQYQERHDFLAFLLRELDAIDRALNHLDALRKQLAERAHATKGNAQLQTLVLGVASRAQAIESDFSSNPQNGEDAFTYTAPDKLRERLQGLLGQIGGSNQPPFGPDRQQDDEIRARFASAMKQYHLFLSLDVTDLNANLSAAHLARVR